ncbi:MAG: 23S rRNA methyltransferase [Gammaproteobacteria bacterium]|jgi:23S rRNA (uridine2552-2'-O)-methyltransferase|nr:23S rRNA methyltransferase [Gammaproteobacteria bacterium]
MARSKSSRAWLQEHFDDHWVQQARALGWRSRAAFKLQQLDERLALLRAGQVVVDLGAAPGSWCQYASARIGERGSLIAVDLLPIEPLPGVTIIEGDFREQAVLEQLQRCLNGRAVDVVLSDMAPNISGIRTVDQTAAMYLAELALDFARQQLRVGGHWICKVFQGEGFDELLRSARAEFEQVRMHKPESSRDRSREQYMVGIRYQGNSCG